MRLISASLCETAEPIKMLFGVNTPGDPGNIVLDGGPDSPKARRGGFNAAFATLLWPLFVSETDVVVLPCTDDRLVDSLKNSPHTSTGTPRDDATPGTSEMTNYGGLHYQDGITPVCNVTRCSTVLLSE